MKLFTRLMEWANQNLGANILAEDDDANVLTKLEEATSNMNLEKGLFSQLQSLVTEQNLVITTLSDKVLNMETKLGELQSTLNTTVASVDTKLESTKVDLLGQVSTAIAEVKTSAPTITNDGLDGKKPETKEVTFDEKDWVKNRVAVRTSN